MEIILNKKQILYYKKQVLLNLKDSDYFQQYNHLLEEAREEETIVFLNQKILESVRDYGNFD